MSFADAANMALRNIFARMGEPAVFAPIVGEEIPCTVIVKTGSDWEGGGNLQVAATQTFINYLRGEIDRKVKAGETFTIASKVYTVRSMAHYPNSWTAFEGMAVVTENS